MDGPLVKTESLYCWSYPRQVVWEPSYWKRPLKNSTEILSKRAKLVQMYTNHFIHSSVITKLDAERFEAKCTMVVLSHKSEHSIKTYASNCPKNKKKECLRHWLNHLKILQYYYSQSRNNNPSTINQNTNQNNNVALEQKDMDLTSSYDQGSPEWQSLSWGNWKNREKLELLTQCKILFTWGL